MDVYFISRRGKYVDRPYLYAVTDKKHLKEQFLKERKKDMFTAVKKDISSKHYKEFLVKNHSYELGRRGYETSSPNSLLKREYVYLISTAYEEMDVFMKADKVILEIGKYTDEVARTFNKKLLVALHKLHYFEIYKFCNWDQYDYFVNGVECFKSDEYMIDSFSVFLYLYGNTLDKKGMINDDE